MSIKIKMLMAILVTFMAMMVMLPESENYYQIAINMVAAETDVPAADLRMQTGSYQNLLLYKTVTVNLMSNNSQSIQAVIQQIPLSDWSLRDYKVVNIE